MQDVHEKYMSLLKNSTTREWGQNIEKRDVHYLTNYFIPYLVTKQKVQVLVHLLGKVPSLTVKRCAAYSLWRTLHGSFLRSRHWARKVLEVEEQLRRYLDECQKTWNQCSLLFLKMQDIFYFLYVHIYLIVHGGFQGDTQNGMEEHRAFIRGRLADYLAAGQDRYSTMKGCVAVLTETLSKLLEGKSLSKEFKSIVEVVFAENTHTHISETFSKELCKKFATMSTAEKISIVYHMSLVSCAQPSLFMPFFCMVKSLTSSRRLVNVQAASAALSMTNVVRTSETERKLFTDMCPLISCKSIKHK